MTNSPNTVLKSELLLLPALNALLPNTVFDVLLSLLLSESRELESIMKLEVP